MIKNDLTKLIEQEKQLTFQRAQLDTQMLSIEGQLDLTEKGIQKIKYQLRDCLTDKLRTVRVYFEGSSRVKAFHIQAYLYNSEEQEGVIIINQGARLIFNVWKDTSSKDFYRYCRGVSSNGENQFMHEFQKRLSSEKKLLVDKASLFYLLDKYLQQKVGTC